MSTLSERLDMAMKRKSPEMKSADLARACRVKAPSVSDWLSGKTKRLEGANLLLAASALDVDPWWLATGEGGIDRKPNAPTPLTYENLSPQAGALIDEIKLLDAQGISVEIADAVITLLSLPHAGDGKARVPLD